MAIYPYQNKLPQIHETVFIAPSATIIGDVMIGRDSSVWFNCTVRGDVNFIRIGERTNIQDGTVIHVDRNKFSCTIGNDCTIGHQALIHACSIGHNCLIGMQACILDGAVVEDGAMVAAGALVTPGKVVKSGEFWAGSPAKMWRMVTPEDVANFKSGNENYLRLKDHYRQTLAELGLSV